MALTESDHGMMRAKLGELARALELAASEAKPRAADALQRMADEADNDWKAIGHGPDRKVANDIRNLLSRVITFKKASGPKWRGALELAKSMDDWMSYLAA